MIATPGHTLDSVSVIVNNCTSGFSHLLENLGPDSVVAVIAGDLFEKEEDLQDESVWIEAGSEDQAKQVLLVPSHQSCHGDYSGGKIVVSEPIF